MRPNRMKICIQKNPHGRASSKLAMNNNLLARNQNLRMVMWFIRARAPTTKVPGLAKEDTTNSSSCNKCSWLGFLACPFPPYHPRNQLETRTPNF